MRAILPSTAIIAIVAAASVSVLALTPAKAADENQPYATLAQAAPGLQSQPGTMAQGQGQGMQSGQPGMMGQGMGMGGMRMGRDRDGKRPGMMRMGGHMMKVMFAIADTDGDGALSFDEVTAVHRRIFNAVDANKDGRVTPDEFRAFMRD